MYICSLGSNNPKNPDGTGFEIISTVLKIKNEKLNNYDTS